MAANFNNSAWFYDRLSRLVYGKALINAQLYLISFIKPNSKILVAGGGTGWILEEITRLYPSGLDITYVEVAANMMALSRKRNVGNNRVTFIQSAIENASLPADFNVVITPFLFDNFTEETLENVFVSIRQSLVSSGQWLNTDFQLTHSWRQRFLLKSMFVFFKLICGIEASKLPEIEKQFNQNGYTIIGEKTFYNNFIVTRVYRR